MAVTVTIKVFDAEVAAIENVPYAPGMNVQQVMEAAYTNATSS